MNPRMMRENVILRRPVTVEVIPAGYTIELQEGMMGQITQALGSSFTLLVEGQLVRLRGEDADAIGQEAPKAAVTATEDDVTPDEVEPLIWEAMRSCYDPEIPVNIVDLGLVYRMETEKINDNDDLKVTVDMTLTAPGCGMGEVIANEVSDKILDLPHVEEITVNLVFDPPWDRSMMSEEALLALGL